MTVALIVAAGRGHRLGGPIPKQYRLLDEVPIIRHTVSAFRRHAGIESVQVVIHPSDRDLYDSATEGMQLPPPLIGGNSRQESVRLGLEGIAGTGPGPGPGAGLGPETVIIHDAVRPFVEQDTISAVIAALDRSPGAVAGLPLADTLKRCDQGRISATLERTHLWRAQTPQGFRYRDILAAHREVYLRNPLGQDLTDDSAVAEAVGLPIEMIIGTDDNFKITTEADLSRAEIILQRGHREIHTGWGFHTQNLRRGTTNSGFVMICGIPVPLPSDSVPTGDADVGLNAITAAMLGTVGGIARDPAMPLTLSNRRLANAENLVRDAVSVVAMAGGRIEHIDLTIICDDREIIAHRTAMVQRTAALLSIPDRRVSVKQLEIDEMGFAFRRDGLSAQCLATINYPADLPD